MQRRKPIIALISCAIALIASSPAALAQRASVDGWPGALVAQQTLRHKSKKASFLAVFWVTVLINCGAALWLHTERGQAALQAFLA